MASKLFILDKDYQRIIQSEIRDEVADASILRESEDAAIEQMISYLNARFDVSNLFPPTNQWNSRMFYQPGDYVDYYGTFVRAMQPTNDDATINRDKAPTGANLSTDGNVGEDVYWSDYCFPNIRDYDNTEAVTAGAYRVENDIFYKCVVDSTGNPPSTNLYDADALTGFWIVDDPRNPLLVEICCKLALYKVHARISPDQIPELRVQEYDMAIEWLKETASGDAAPMLAKPPKEEDDKSSVQYGGLPRKDYTF